MDGTTLNSRVWAGYAKAAKYIGTTYQHYRPNGPNSPLAAGNRLADMPVSLNAEDPRFARPNVYGKATWYAVADGAQLQVGDYIVGVEGTLFVAALQQLLPIFMVDCNRTVSLLRPAQQSGVGAQGYGGGTDVGLPGDVKTPWWIVLLPQWAGVTLRTSDIITDDLGRRYVISSAELTDLGWRLTAMQAQT